MIPDRKQVARTKGGVVHPSTLRGIAKLGRDLSRARRARRISTTEMAARMGVGRSTLHRLEHGDPGVSLNTLAMALSVLGLFDRLADLADPAADDIGLMMAQKSLPRNIVRRRASSRQPQAPGPASGAEDDAPEGW